MNSFGTKFRVSLFGESHGEFVGVVIDGLPHGIHLCEDDFLGDLNRRRPMRFGTPRREADYPRIVSGLYNGYTTGAPLSILFQNENQIPEEYRNFSLHPRPSHADFAAHIRYEGFNDPRGAGHLSGRLTLGIVAAGVVAKKVLGEGILFFSRICAVGGNENEYEWNSLLEKAALEGDSLGGIVKCTVNGVPAGWGDPIFNSVESLASQILFSIPAVKGVQFGSGFAAAASTGSANNDLIVSSEGTTATNNDGGITGGITNGNPLEVSIAVKPTPSISLPQQTYDLESGMQPLVIEGRHDVCIALRMPVIVEAAMAITLAQFGAVKKR